MLSQATSSTIVTLNSKHLSGHNIYLWISVQGVHSTEKIVNKQWIAAYNRECNIFLILVKVTPTGEI